MVDEEVVIVSEPKIEESRNNEAEGRLVRGLDEGIVDDVSTRYLQGSRYIRSERVLDTTAPYTTSTTYRQERVIPSTTIIPREASVIERVIPSTKYIPAETTVIPRETVVERVIPTTTTIVPRERLISYTPVVEVERPPIYTAPVERLVSTTTYLEPAPAPVSYQVVERIPSPTYRYYEDQAPERFERRERSVYDDHDRYNDYDGYTDGYDYREREYESAPRDGLREELRRVKGELKQKDVQLDEAKRRIQRAHSEGLKGQMARQEMQYTRTIRSLEAQIAELTSQIEILQQRAWINTERDSLIRERDTIISTTSNNYEIELRRKLSDAEQQIERLREELERSGQSRARERELEMWLSQEKLNLEQERQYRQQVMGDFKEESSKLLAAENQISVLKRELEELSVYRLRATTLESELQKVRDSHIVTSSAGDEAVRRAEERYRAAEDRARKAEDALRRIESSNTSSSEIHIRRNQELETRCLALEREIKELRANGTNSLAAQERIRQLERALQEAGKGAHSDVTNLEKKILQLEFQLKEARYRAERAESSLVQLEAKLKDQQLRLNSRDVLLDSGRDLMVYQESIKGDRDLLWAQKLREAQAEAFKADELRREAERALQDESAKFLRYINESESKASELVLGDVVELQNRVHMLEIALREEKERNVDRERDASTFLRKLRDAEHVASVAQEKLRALESSRKYDGPISREQLIRAMEERIEKLETTLREERLIITRLETEIRTIQTQYFDEQGKRMNLEKEVVSLTTRHESDKQHQVKKLQDELDDLRDRHGYLEDQAERAKDEIEYLRRAASPRRRRRTPPPPPPPPPPVVQAPRQVVVRSPSPVPVVPTKTIIHPPRLIEERVLPPVRVEEVVVAAPRVVEVVQPREEILIAPHRVVDEVVIGAPRVIEEYSVSNVQPTRVVEEFVAHPREEYYTTRYEDELGPLQVIEDVVPVHGQRVLVDNRELLHTSEPVVRSLPAVNSIHVSEQQPIINRSNVYLTNDTNRIVRSNGVVKVSQPPVVVGGRSYIR